MVSIRILDVEEGMVTRQFKACDQGIAEFVVPA
jgi:hypothetical protein